MAHDVQLDNTFSGPMDLLLYLVRRDEIDIHDIPIHHLTREYLSELDKMRDIDVDLASEFLTLASMLMEIKSRMLLPPTESEEGEEDEDALDPRAGLVQALLEYKRFKEAATALGTMAEEHALRFARIAPAPRFIEAEEGDIDGVGPLDLLVAFQKMVRNMLAPDAVEIVNDEVSTEVRIEQIRTRLGQSPRFTFSSLLSDAPTKGEMVGFFIAMLELIRLRILRARQSEDFSDIQLVRRDIKAEEAEESLHRKRDAERREARRPRRGVPAFRMALVLASSKEIQPSRRSPDAMPATLRAGARRLISSGRTPSAFFATAPVAPKRLMAAAPSPAIRQESHSAAPTKTTGAPSHADAQKALSSQSGITIAEARIPRRPSARGLVPPFLEPPKSIEAVAPTQGAGLFPPVGRTARAPSDTKAAGLSSFPAAAPVRPSHSAKADKGQRQATPMAASALPQEQPRPLTSQSKFASAEIAPRSIAPVSVPGSRVVPALFAAGTAASPSKVFIAAKTIALFPAVAPQSRGSASTREQGAGIFPPAAPLRAMASTIRPVARSAPSVSSGGTKAAPQGVTAPHLDATPNSHRTPKETPAGQNQMPPSKHCPSGRGVPPLFGEPPERRTTATPAPAASFPPAARPPVPVRRSRANGRARFSLF